MSRVSEIDSFLRQQANFAKNDINMTPNFVYGQLMRYDFTGEEYRNGDTSVYFDYWAEYFKNKKNIRVFSHPDQQSFLQFWGKEDGNSEYIKLYLSVDANSMLKTVNDIFSHLEKRNVDQASKVANRVRSDSIVLRIKDEKDAKEIIDYINNDEYIKNNSRKTNPFLLREGVVGMAYDDELSYNTAVSFLVSEYINNKKDSQDLSNVNCIDFSNYVSEYSRELITNKDFLNNFMEKDYFIKNAKRLEYYDNASILSNMKRVFDLVDFNLNENNKYEDFINMYNNSLNNKEEISNDFRNLLVEKEKVESHEVDQNALLNEYLNVAFSKYQTRESVSEHLNNYIEGNIRAITRDNNLRMRFMKDLYPKDLLILTNGNVEEYIEKYLEIQDKYSVFINSCIATYEKYGLLQLGYAINKVTNGDYTGFTRDNGLRTMMKEKLNIEDIKECIKRVAGLSNIELEENYGLSCARIIEDTYVNEKENIGRAK